MSFVAAGLTAGLDSLWIVFGTFRIFYQPLCWYETRSTVHAKLLRYQHTHVPSHMTTFKTLKAKHQCSHTSHISQTKILFFFVLVLPWLPKASVSPSFFCQRGMIIGKGGECVKVPSWVKKVLWLLQFSEVPNLGFLDIFGMFFFF